MAFGRLGSMGAGFGHLGASPGGGVAAAAGGAALLAGETNGFATDFTYATDLSRVAVKTAGAVAYSGLSFFTNASASTKWVFDITGTLVNVAAGSLAVDYHPSTHAALGLLVEKTATNLLLNNTTLSTQSVTVSAVAYTLSFLGTGTITLTGVSTAGPLVGTGASNRVSLTFTPTAGSLTLTVTGTVSNAQLETGTVPTSIIRTVGASATRAADKISFLVSAIPAWTTEFSIYCRLSAHIVTTNHWGFCLTNGPGNDYVGFQYSGGAIFNLNGNDAGGTACQVLGPVVTAGTFYSAASRIKLNDCNMSVDGAAVGLADTAVTVATPLVYGILGSDSSNVVTVQSYRIQKLMIVPRGWNDATLVTQSAVT